MQLVAEENARDLAANLLKAVHAMHSFPIVHRDIKPENLLLKSMESDTDIKIADFGFATQVSCSDNISTCDIIRFSICTQYI